VIISYNHAFDIPESEARRQLYDMPVYPTVVFDGTDKQFISDPSLYDSLFNQSIQVAKSAAPLYNLELNGMATPSTGSLSIKIWPADTLHYDSVYAFVAICEDSLRGIVRDFNYVARQLYSFPVDLFFPDSIDTMITFSHTTSPDKMRAVLFIQKLDTKNVLQAIGKKFN
jgi:hypothetical protein